MRKGDFTMIYFDNAATTRRKPQEVVQAVTEALCSLGNAGRGAHEATLQASRTIYDTRRKLAEFPCGKSGVDGVYKQCNGESEYCD